MNPLKILILLPVATSLATAAPSSAVTDKRINDLLDRMTLEEKIGQLHQIDGSGNGPDLSEQVRSGKVGSILNVTNLQAANELQRAAVEGSRLGIPLVFARDVIHGYKTIFPIPLGQAATWNPALAERCARVAAKEASADGIRWTFAPMIDVARDPRWGRIAESPGEDPVLAAAFGTAMIRGFQGGNLAAQDALAACAKHFAGYGAAEAGKDYNTTWIPEVQLRDVYLPPFEAAARAGVASFMCSFNDINGVPSSGNTYLNRRILREEWSFPGVLVSDWASIEQMIAHGVCADLREAAALAATSGVDIDMMGFAYSKHLGGLVADGKVNETAVDDAVRRVLEMKQKLGLFEHPYADARREPPFYQPESLTLARQCAAESVILLKNNGVLPLRGTLSSIAVTGPLADAPADQLGTWVFDGEPERSITPLMAIREACGEKIRVIGEPGLSHSRDMDSKGIQRAVNAARHADVILMFAGEEAILSGEALSRADISLPGAQGDLLAALKATGKPVVLVVMSGRPNTLTREAGLADALLLAFHGGTMAGPALADVIFGDTTPSGKLPVTMPRMVGQIPVYHAHKSSGRPAKDIVLMDDIPVGAGQTSLGCTSYHLDAGDKPLYPFGHGLSYTTFDYGEVILSAGAMSAGGSITATCRITNTGSRDAHEVVQLYLRDVVGSLARPVRELKRFEKIFLKRGESREVSFTLTANDLSFWHGDMTRRAEPGEFHVWISPDSQSGRPASFRLR